MTERPYIVGFLKVRNEIVREGNIYRALENMGRFCDTVVACDDASNDGTRRVLETHPLVSKLLVVPEGEQDFRRELEWKQRLLEEVHRLAPTWVWWHDGDEELEGADGFRDYCCEIEPTAIPAVRFHYRQLWRSRQWIRTDDGFGEGSFIKLWRWSPDLSFDVRPGTHHAQFPRQLMEVLGLIPQAPLEVVHWGNFGKNLVWKCIQYHGGLGGVDRHLRFERAKYVPLHAGSVPTEPEPVPFTQEEKERVLGMQGLRRTPGWFTVVIPAHNRANTLPAALRSLVAQTYRQWVAVVLDDGSTDGTPEVMREWQDRDPRIFYCRYPDNRGGVAMNEVGMALACEWTEWWSRLGSDDFFDPEKLELDAWALSHGAEAVYGPYRAIRGNARGELCNPPYSPGTTRAALLAGNFACSWANVAISCAALERVRSAWGGFCDPRLRNMEDFLVNARVAAVTDGFHFRGLVAGERAYADSEAEGERLGRLRADVHEDAVWRVASDGASGDGVVTARDDALTREILQTDPVMASMRGAR